MTKVDAAERYGINVTSAELEPWQKVWEKCHCCQNVRALLLDYDQATQYSRIDNKPGTVHPTGSVACHAQRLCT